MFSSRLPPNRAPNALSERLDAFRAAGVEWVDLTESNPTRAGFVYPSDLLQQLADPAALRYEPHPFGLRSAREAVARDCARRGASVDPADVVLAASTSEAYSWLFKLLCNPGDNVLVPRPSYPLFEHLTRLEDVEPRPYPLEYHGRWTIDVDALSTAASTRTRAVLIVSPNNPTGSYLKPEELTRLASIALERNWAIVADEVFADFPLDVTEPLTDISSRTEALSFTLGGLSKCVGLPQLKLGWIVAGGAWRTRAAALSALELIADSYLSVATPVQVAVNDLLARGGLLRRQIQDRVRRNLDCLKSRVAGTPACQLLFVEGGWYAVVRVPAMRSEEDLALGLLERERILVHPGFFFDFPTEAFVVVSLLPQQQVFDDAVARFLQFATVSV
jgi:alanine-synthesizing transaminase